MCARRHGSLPIIAYVDLSEEIVVRSPPRFRTHCQGSTKFGLEVSVNKCGQPSSIKFSDMSPNPPLTRRITAPTPSGSILECLFPHCLQGLGQPAHSSLTSQLDFITCVRFAASWIYSKGFLPTCYLNLVGFLLPQMEPAAKRPPKVGSCFLREQSVPMRAFLGRTNP